MEALKNIGKGNRADRKRIPDDTNPVYQTDLNNTIDKINEIIGEIDSIVADIEDVVSDIATLQEADAGLVPYTGAASDLDLGTNGIKAADARIGTEANNTTFEADGTMVASGDAICYRDEFPGGVFLVPSGSSAPDSTTYTIGGIPVVKYAFDGGSTAETMSNSFEIPHDYALGKPIEAHVHWAASTTGSGDVKWFFDYCHIPVNGAPVSKTGLSVTATVSSNQQYYHKISTFGNLADLTYGIGDMILFNIRRNPSDAADTYSSDAILLQVALHIPVDTLGSRQLYIK